MAAKCIYRVADVCKTILGLKGGVPPGTTFFSWKDQGWFLRKAAELEEITAGETLASTPLEKQVGSTLYVTFSTADDKGEKLSMSYTREEVAPEPSLSAKKSIGIGCEIPDITLDYVRYGVMDGLSLDEMVTEAFFRKFPLPKGLSDKKTQALYALVASSCAEQMLEIMDEGGQERILYTSMTQNLNWVALHVHVDLPYSEDLLAVKYKDSSITIAEEWIKGDLFETFRVLSNCEQYDTWSQQLALFQPTP